MQQYIQQYQRARTHVLLCELVRTLCLLYCCTLLFLTQFSCTSTGEWDAVRWGGTHGRIAQ